MGAESRRLLSVCQAREGAHDTVIEAAAVSSPPLTGPDPPIPCSVLAVAFKTENQLMDDFELMNDGKWGEVLHTNHCSILKQP